MEEAQKPSSAGPEGPAEAPAVRSAALSGDVAAGSRAHPLARHLYGVLRDRSVEDMVLVLNALDRRLGTGMSTDKQEVAYQALKVFVDTEGRFPAANQWDYWRNAADDCKHLPSATFVRNAFGDWPAARAAFESAPQFDIFARRLVANGDEFEELSVLVALVHAFAQTRTEDRLFREDFFAYLKTEAPRDAGFEVWPRDWQPFRRHGFTEWHSLLRTCGLEQRVGRRGGRPVVPAPAHTQNEQPAESDLLRLVETWAETVDGPLLQADFLAWWRSAELATSGPLFGVRASWTHFRAFFKTWSAVLDAVGMSDRAAVHFTESRQPGRRNDGSPRKGTTVTHRSSPEPLAAAEVRQRAVDAELDNYLFAECLRLADALDADDKDASFAWARLAAEKFGAAMSYPQYDGWRFDMQARASEAGFGRLPIPHSKTLKDRVESRSWFDVKVRAAIPGAAELAKDRKDRRGYPREAVIDAVQAAMYRHGHGLTSTQYEEFYDSELARRRKQEMQPRMPNVKLVRETIGGPNHLWEVVVETVLRERPGLRHLPTAAPDDPASTDNDAQEAA